MKNRSTTHTPPVLPAAADLPNGETVTPAMTRGGIDFIVKYTLLNKGAACNPGIAVNPIWEGYINGLYRAMRAAAAESGDLRFAADTAITAAEAASYAGDSAAAAADAMKSVLAKRSDASAAGGIGGHFSTAGQSVTVTGPQSLGS
jgi:hypothetical protein